jgi:hypothetical protein
MLARGPAERGCKGEPLTWLFESGGFAPMARVSASETLSFVCDYLGTPVMVVDRTGTHVWNASLNAFGPSRDRGKLLGLSISLARAAGRSRNWAILQPVSLLRPGEWAVRQSRPDRAAWWNTRLRVRSRSTRVDRSPWADRELRAAPNQACRQSAL